MELANRVPEVMASLGDLGLVCVFTIDGERDHKQWTVVISGEPLAGRHIRIDGNSLEYCLTKSLTKLREPERIGPGLGEGPAYVVLRQPLHLPHQIAGPRRAT